MRSIRHIGIIVPTIAGGGAERVVTVLANSLYDQGFLVDVILYERKKDEYPLLEGVHVHLLPDKSGNQNRFSYLTGKLAYLRKLIKNLSPDILIPFLPYQVLHCFVASRGLGVPMVVTVRANPQCDTPNERMRGIRDWIAKHVEGVFLQTESQKSYFAVDMQKKCFVVPNPVSWDVLNAQVEYRQKVKRIVTMGRLEKQKRHDLLIKAFAKMNADKKMALEIYGVGSLEETLRDLIKKLGQEECIRLMGRTSNVADTLKKYDLFVLTSDYEGMPNALMEAMAVGLPCISTDCPTGPRELIDNMNRGILIPADNQIEIEKAISWAACNTDSLQAMGREAKKYIMDNYSPTVISRRLVNELRNLK